jgi:uncharacterized membrane protein
MLQVWRVQQVAQIVTIALLSFTVSGIVFDAIKWRFSGTLLANSYVMVPLLIALIAAIVWMFAIWWDMRMKMWREQATVLVERNPYLKEKLSAKEVAQYELLWLPVLDRLGKDDPSVKKSTDYLRVWIRKSYILDPALESDVKEVYRQIEEYGRDLAKAKK